MKVNYNKVLNHSVQLKSCKEIIKESREAKIPTIKRCGTQLMTIGIPKEKQFIQKKMIDEKFEEFKRDVVRMEQYMCNYVHKLAGKLIKFAEEQRKILKIAAADKEGDLVPGTIPKFEYSKTRVLNFKRTSQVLLSIINIKPDEQPLDLVYAEIEKLTGTILDLEKEIDILRNGIPQPPVEVPVIEVLDFGKMDFYDRSDYVKKIGMDTGFLRSITAYMMTKDGRYILVCNDQIVCLKQ